jgi:exoribonuclease-2
MLERGLDPQFPEEALREAAGLQGESPPALRDLRSLLWCSIDNEDSRDLDQLTVADESGGRISIRIAIADVDEFVRQGGGIDRHAQHNTTSVYTAAVVFHMLPERLSTDLTSLNEHKDRLALVTEFEVESDGHVVQAQIYRALVRNQAKLAYPDVADWLDGAKQPAAMARVPGLDANLRLQALAAERLRGLRYLNGALELNTIEAVPVFDGERLHSLRAVEKSRAREIIEDFMIAANGVTAAFLASRGYASIRRTVGAPRRWDRIMQLAEEHGFVLPRQPDSRSLARFLAGAREADPLRFPDLSLSIVKLLGAGEYSLELPGTQAQGHFGLAVKDYAHSTAPNRRFPDLITQRLLKAALEGRDAPYSHDELHELARHCTFQEDAARRVERQLGKSAAALLLEEEIGEQFDALVTGVTPTGCWLRLLDPPVEGRLVRGTEGLDIGRKLRVELVDTDVMRGYIDFKRVR